jgi:hypothetical protein
MQGAPWKTTQAGHVRTDIIVTLLLWYLIYVVFDVLSTYWLINHSAVGIMGEANPIAVALYRALGLGGLLIGKLSGFIPMAVASIMADARYGGIGWFRELVETLLLSLIGASAIVALHNFGSILAVEFFRRGVEHLGPWVALTAIPLALALQYVTFRVLRLGDRVRLVEAAMGTLLILTPLFVWREVFISALQRQPILFAAYIAIMYPLVAAAIYLVEEIRKGRGRANLS